jgi:muconolactone D-isomerase
MREKWQEYMVTMHFNFPETWTREEMQDHYLQEGRRATELANAGLFERVWRLPGERGHVSIWRCDNADTLHQALESWPMFMYMTIQVQEFAINHNDPGGIAEELPHIRFTYPVLRKLLDEHHAHSEDHGFDLGAGISIHDHPNTDRGLQIHVMCDGQKIAEIGPDKDYQEHESVVSGYVGLLAEWEGRPVRHVRWQNRILDDNRLVHPDYAAAARSTRNSRPFIHGQ